ncbi:MAG: prenyltransferase [Culicoidibacterales bacterium]
MSEEEVKNDETCIQRDREKIFSHRFDHGANFWSTVDNRLIKGAPFSTLESVSYLYELGELEDSEVTQEIAPFIWQSWHNDGRFQVAPHATIYPCQTAAVALALLQLGCSSDERLKVTYRHFLQIQETDGGWRCRKFSFGHGPETLASNPHPTLNILNFFRYFPDYQQQTTLNRAVEFLLSHWETRLPLGPCHYGMGKRFMQIEYPFRHYNIFYYVYVLSFYQYAHQDKRFLAALAVLETKCENGMIVVERVVPELAELSFCQKNHPSFLATKRYQEIIRNVAQSQIHLPKG